MAVSWDSLRTPRLLMRRWRDTDREPFAAMNADPEVMRYFRASLDRAGSDAFIERIERAFDRYGFGLWVLHAVETDQFLGFTGLYPMPEGELPGSGGIEVGWRLARHAWGHGYATEAATVALRVAFEEAGLAEVWSMTAVLNERSQAVMRRLGMAPHAYFEHPTLPPEHPLRPHVAYRLAAARLARP